MSNVNSALSLLNNSDYLSVVVTNQPIIAKGIASIEQVEYIHNYMESILGQQNVYLDRIYFCPHHPEKGFKGECKEYKIACNCRKPSTGMIDKAAVEMNIDLHQSFIIGDRTVDIMTGINSNINTVLIRQGHAGKDMKYNCHPDFIFEDLLEAVQFIIRGYNKLINIVKEHLTNKIIHKRQYPVIIVGGLSRSGKSTLSVVISKYLEQLGKQVKIMNLDNWLHSCDQRTTDMEVLQRDRDEAIETDVKTLLRGERIKVNRYDHKTKKINSRKVTLCLTAGDILLIDGVIGLDQKYIRKVADVSFLTHVSEGLRKKRFYKYYDTKLMPNKEIKILYNNKNKYEADIIKGTNKFANAILEMDFTK